MLGKTNVVIGVEKIGVLNQNKTITQNGTYKADEGYTGLGEVTVDVSQNVANFYNTDMASEILSEVLLNSLHKLTDKATNILGIVDNYQNFDNYVYKAATIKEYYQNVLTVDNKKAVKILTNVLGV